MSHTVISPSDALPAASWSSLTRVQAFAIHVALSLLAFSTLVFVMLRWWFPGELFMLDGGWQGLKLVAMVDLVLGPALTLLLYKPGKPGLLLDLLLIAAIQLGALGYGFVTTWQQRTVAVVYADGKFTTLSSSALTTANAELRERKREPQPLPATGQTGPSLLYVPPPSKDDFGQYLTELLNGFPEPHERSDLFVAAAERQQELRSKALDEGDLVSSGEWRFVANAVSAMSPDSAGIEMHRFKSRYASGIALLDPQSVIIVDYVPIDRAALKAVRAAMSSKKAEKTADTGD